MSRTLTASDRKALIRFASTLPRGSEERRAVLTTLSKGADALDKTARESRLVQKVKAMSDEERKKLPFGESLDFKRDQYDPAVKAMVRKVARFVADEINKAAPKLDILYVDPTTGELKPSPFKAQGLLERTIPELTDELKDMV